MMRLARTFYLTKDSNKQQIFVILFTETLHYILHSHRREIDG